MTVESGRLSRLTSSRSATHKASTPCLLSGKVCLVLVMIYIYIFLREREISPSLNPQPGGPSVAIRQGFNRYSFKGHQGTQISLPRY